MSDTLRASNLHFGLNSSNFNQPQIGFTSVGIGSTANYGFLQFFGTSNTLCWTANGTVGIGTAAPGYLLDVYGSNPTLRIRTSTGAYSSGTASILFDTITSSYPLARITGIDVGISPNVYRGDLAFYYQYNTALIEGMRLANTGNVGIGIATPGATLHVNGTFTCNNPIFSVVRSGTFSIASNIDTRVPYNSVDFDTNSGWNNSSYQYKPTVAGYYQFSWCVTINSLTAGGTQEFFASLFKNGITYAWGNDLMPSTVHYSSTTGSCILYLNGSTDYVEIFVYQNSGAAVLMNPTNNFPMRFTGYMLRS